MGRFVELEGWKRREHYEHFRAMPNPWFGICVELEVTRLWDASRQPGGPSFFLAALFLAMRAVNGTEALRMRLRPEGVWLHDQVHASSTILRPDETFVFTEFPTRDRFVDFQEAGLTEIARVQDVPALGGKVDRDDLIYHSSLPWIRFTAFTNPRSTTDDSIPRIVFGKCFQREGGWQMPLSVEVHHALVDGLDVARFLERFQEGLVAADLE